MKTIKQKIKIIESLPGCGWSIRAEARIAAEALKLETERHVQALRDIEDRFQIEAWRHVEGNWEPSEIEQCARS